MTANIKTTKRTLLTLRSNASNILNLLRMASSNKNTSEILDHIISVIQNHFNRVEALDIDFPKDSKQEHVSLMAYFTKMEAAWCKGEISDASYADALDFNLFNHFSVHFKPLLDRELGEGSTRDFRIG